MDTLYPLTAEGLTAKGADFFAKNPPTPRDYSAMERLGYGVATAIPNAIQGLVQTGAGVATLFGDTTAHEDAQFMPQTGLPPGTTTGENLADLASGLMPLALQLPIGGVAGKALGAITGASRIPILARGLTQAAEFGQLGLQQSGTTGAEQAGEGLASGLISRALPRFGIARPLAAGLLGLGSKMFIDRNGDTQTPFGGITAGDIQGTALGVTTALLGAPIKGGWHFNNLPGEVPTKVPTSSPSEPAYNFDVANRINAATGVGYRNAPTAFQSARAMQEAWGQIPAPVSDNPQAAWDLYNLNQTVAGRANATEALRQHGAAAEARFNPPPNPYDLPPRSNTPLLAVAGADNPLAPITDMQAELSQQAQLQRSWPPVVQKGGMFTAPARDILAGGPVGPELREPAPLINQIMDPANAQAVQQAAIPPYSQFRDPDLLHQSQMTLQQLQTQWFAEDVHAANRQQDVNLHNWTQGLIDRPDAVDSQVVKLAKMPSLSAEDLATELRARPEEIAQHAKDVGIDPEDTLGVARALKEKYDPSLQPRTPPAHSFTDAELEGMLTGDYPHLSPEENQVLRGMNQRDPNRMGQSGEADMALLYAGARGLAGASASLYGTSDNKDMTPTEKMLMAAAVGVTSMFGPSVIRALGRTGEAEAKIPTWGGKQTPRIGPAVEPPPKWFVNPRLAEEASWADEKSVAVDNQDTLQRLQNESTVKGKIQSTPEYLRSEGGGVGGVGSGQRPPDNITEFPNKPIDQELKAFHAQNRLDIESRVEANKKRIIPTKFKDGDMFTSAQTGRQYIFRGDAPPATIGKNAGVGKVWMEDPFNGNIGAMYHWGIKELQDGSMLDRTLRDVGGGMKKGSDEGAFFTPETQAAMGRAAIGGLIGSAAGSIVDDPGSHTGMVAGAITGGLLTMFGPSILKEILAHNANAKAPDLSNASPLLKPFTTTTDTPKYSLGEAVSKAQLAGLSPRAVGQTTTTFRDRTLQRLDKWFGMSKGDAFSRVLGQSNGPAAELTQRMDTAFHNISLLTPDEATNKMVNDYLDGTMPKDAFRQQMSASPTQKAMADFATVARESADGLIELASRGQGNAERSQMMKDSMGQYLTRSHRLFVDKSYSPSVESTQALAKKLKEIGGWGDDEHQIELKLSNYVKEIKENAGVYRSSEGKKIEQTAFMHRKDFETMPAGQEWKQFLGEITDPQDRVKLTMLKLKPMAEASQFMHLVTNGLNRSDEGLQYAFRDEGELQAAKAKVLDSLKTNPQDAQLRKQLLELQQYQYVLPNPQHGALQGQWVHRNVRDVLNEWQQSQKVDSAAGRALMGINQFMKSNVTYRNPMGILRQAITAPFFLQIGRGFSHATEAWDVMRNPDHPMYAELLQNGITNVDRVTRDVLRDVNQLHQGRLAINGDDGVKAFLGRADLTIAKASALGKLVDSKLADAFRFPDNLVRVATYMAAKARIAGETGLALDAQEVINKAVEHTNRYTMNYDLLPQAVVKGRNFPFVNMFISYTAEMGRIMKNLGQDLIAGKGAEQMNAAMALATMVAIPEVAQRISEGSMSAQDQKEWQRVKANLPAYLKDQYQIVRRDQKTGQFHVTSIQKLLPAGDLQSFGRALAEGRIKDAGANNPVTGFDNNPALNIASSFITGKDRITGRTERGPSDYFATVAKEIGGPLTPEVGSTPRRFNQAYDINVSGTRGLTDSKGRTLTPTDFWLDTILSIRNASIDPKTIDAGVVSDYKGRVANEMAYYNDVVKTHPEPKVVQAAGQRTKQALLQLRDDLHQRLGIEPTKSNQ